MNNGLNKELQLLVEDGDEEGLDRLLSNDSNLKLDDRDEAGNLCL